MIDWNDKSDGKSVFFDGQVRENEMTNSDAVLVEMIDFLLSKIIGKNNAVDFDRLFLEINCDTGRVITAATTRARKENSHIDGCSIRLQEIQDYWYDLVEGGVSDDEFTVAIAKKVTELGQVFGGLVEEHLEELRTSCSKDGFEYIVYGSEPSVPYFEKHYTA